MLNRRKTIWGGILLITLTATRFSAGTLTIAEFAFLKGFPSLFNRVCTAATSLWMGWAVLSRLSNYQQVTLGGIVGKIYGNSARFLTILLGLLLSIIIIVAQLHYVRGVAPHLDVPPNLLVLFLGIFITLYTCLGGFRSVLWTDALQFSFLVFGSLAFFVSVFSQNLLPIEGASIEQHFSFWEPSSLFGLFLVPFFWNIWHTLFNTNGCTTVNVGYFVRFL